MTGVSNASQSIIWWVSTALGQTQQDIPSDLTMQCTWFIFPKMEDHRLQLFGICHRRELQMYFYCVYMNWPVTCTVYFSTSMWDTLV